MKFRFRFSGLFSIQNYVLALVGCLVLCFLFACQSNQREKLVTDTPIADTAKFYPIEKFIQDEIQYVDLRDFTITETYVYDNGDTVNAKGVNSQKQLTKDEFISEAREIKNMSLWFSKNKNLFRETLFQDLGTESYTINYQSEKADIKNIDLLLNQQTNLPKRLFVRQIAMDQGNTITVQYSWIAGKQFSIAKSIHNGRRIIWQSNKTIQWKNKP